MSTRFLPLSLAALIAWVAPVAPALSAAEAVPRPPRSEAQLAFWLRNMVWDHRFSVEEVGAATGLSEDAITGHLQRLGISEESRPERPADGPLRVLPYPGGRHPRAGFLDGALRPQRETKASVFTPWDEASYVVVDVPEALWSNLGLTYLAHTHIDTIWTGEGVELPQLEWTRHPGGVLECERRLPNGIVFGTRIVPEARAARMEMWLFNGTDETLSDLRVQNCVMLKAAAGFAAQSAENKLISAPYVACRSEEGDRWIITAWDPCDRPWTNPPVPCLHSDPKFPDCPPGQRRHLRGWLSFYEGDDIDAELARIDATGWRTDALPRDWIAVGGDRGAARFSDLDEIDRGNVGQLEVAWTYHTGELDRPVKKTIECTPLAVGGILYLSTGHLRVAALDAATGAEKWVFDPLSVGPPAGPLASGGVNRGVAYWTDGESERVLHGTSDGRLFSLDARTGEPDPGFGDSGVRDLREGIEWDVSRDGYGPTSAPAIFEDLVILGFSNPEGPPPGAPGDIRAFDVRSGAEVWRFHTIPRPGEFGADTWMPGEGDRRPGANAWGGVSVDTARGLVFAGTGSPGFDFYGGDRKGQNLFANCVLALDASTGERRWHYQILRHDLWDHDIPVYPNLVTLRRDGKDVPAVAQVTKTGHVFVFERETGRPVFEIEERPVPASDIPGEEAWPTQPIPLKPPPFALQKVDEEDLTDLSPEAHAAVLARFREVRGGPAYNPPSLEGTIVVPGFHGGANWSGASFDPDTGTLYVNATNEPCIVSLKKNDSGFPYAHGGYERFRDPEGYPAVKPPWGTLNAIDLNRGELLWQIPLGAYPELTARGHPPTGTPNFGGSIVTAGGLVFIAGTKDEKIRAFDKGSGEVLWEHALPAGGYATPCTYRAGGRQFVVIAAGGAGKLGTRPGDAIVAFALP
ncbi:hypothetical protein BH23VER1_BH23VER1_34350 [soil metagenome]